jgi:uncharacterized membrane protein YkvA (DUF1232 family)
MSLMQNSPNSAPLPPKEGRSVINSILVGLVGFVSAFYLFNPTAGILELIPDNIPVIGNLDEATAAALLISALAYFGVDLGRLFGKARSADKKNADLKKNGPTVDADFVER